MSLIRVNKKYIFKIRDVRACALNIFFHNMYMFVHIKGWRATRVTRGVCSSLLYIYFHNMYMFVHIKECNGT